MLRCHSVSSILPIQLVSLTNSQPASLQSPCYIHLPFVLEITTSPPICPHNQTVMYLEHAVRRKTWVVSALLRTPSCCNCLPTLSPNGNTPQAKRDWNVEHSIRKENAGPLQMSHVSNEGNTDPLW